MSDERRDWSFISSEKFLAYMQEGEKLIEVARRMQIHPFAAAVAGVAFIRNALAVMGGDVNWWLGFVRTGNLPGLELPRVRSQNPPTS